MTFDFSSLIQLVTLLAVSGLSIAQWLSKRKHEDNQNNILTNSSQFELFQKMNDYLNNQFEEFSKSNESNRSKEFLSLKKSLQGMEAQIKCLQDKDKEFEKVQHILKLESKRVQILQLISAAKSEKGVKEATNYYKMIESLYQEYTSPPNKGNSYISKVFHSFKDSYNKKYGIDIKE